MKKKILLPFLIYLSLTPLFSNNKVLIFSNKKQIITNIENLISSMPDNNILDIETIYVNDDLEDKNYSGSIEYLDRQMLNPPLFACYIDSSEDQNIMVYGFNNRKQPNKHITQNLLKSLNIETQISKDLPLYITKIIPQKPIIEIYKDRDIPLLLITGNLDLEILLKTLSNKYELINSENFYYIISFFGQIYYIGELQILITSLVFVSILVFLVSIFSKRLKFHFRSNKKYIISIPLKIFIIFSFLFISTLIIEYIINYSGSRSIISNNPKSLLIIKYLVLTFIYGVSFQILKDKSFSDSPYFYSYLSFFSSIITYLILSIIYLPLGFYQLWPILLTIIFIITKDRTLHTWLLLLSPIVLVILISNYLTDEYTNFSKLLIISRYKGNILLTGLSIPYIFLQESNYRLIHRKQKKRSYTMDIILSLIILTITITYIAILLEINKI